jgi:uncharacterized protein (TIGR03437 family)
VAKTSAPSFGERPDGVNGTGFTGSVSTCSGMTVSFNGTAATCTFVSATHIKTSVPALATTGPLAVNGQVAASPSFTVTTGSR